MNPVCCSCQWLSACGSRLPWRGISHTAGRLCAGVVSSALTSRRSLAALRCSVMHTTSLVWLRRVPAQLLFTHRALACKLWTLMKVDVSVLEYRRSLCAHSRLNFCSFFFGREPISAADKRSITNICQSGMQRLHFHLKMVWVFGTLYRQTNISIYININKKQKNCL